MPLAMHSSKLPIFTCGGLMRELGHVAELLHPSPPSLQVEHDGGFLLESYDYIIVGGGTAGCILADKLTADGRNQVLLLEAGDKPRSIWIPIPAGFTKLLSSEKYNWRFKSEPEPSTNGRVIPVHRGKGLGGSSLINGMIYVRGQKQDYDSWEREGAKGWNFDTLEPYFRDLERYQEGGKSRGKNGPLYLEKVKQRFSLSDRFLEAAVQAGHALNEDYNASTQEGFGYYQVNQRKGRRWSPYDAYLKPAQRRSNLRVLTGAHVISLNLEGQRCAGLTFLQNGKVASVQARGEIVLSAGAVQTPQILELSGIGDPTVLHGAGIETRAALPGVGANYCDHYIPRMNWRVRNTRTLNETTRGASLVFSVAEYLAGRTGLLTLATGLVFGFIKTRPELATPDAQYMFVNASYANAGVRTLDKLPGMTMGVMPLRPESRGTIHARSANPFDQPIIRPNFLTAESDQKCLIDSMREARRIVEQPALQNFVDYELSPGAAVSSDDEWLAFARENGQTGSHPLGTCRMGDDDTAVVDSNLKLRGIHGVRIVDASVIPKMVSGNIHAAVMVIALRAADLILSDKVNQSSQRAIHLTVQSAAPSPRRD